MSVGFYCRLSFIAIIVAQKGRRSSGGKSDQKQQLSNKIMILRLFSISNFRPVLNVLGFLLGNSPASEFYIPTFRYTLFHLHRQADMKGDWVSEMLGYLCGERFGSYRGC